MKTKKILALLMAFFVMVTSMNLNVQMVHATENNQQEKLVEGDASEVQAQDQSSQTTEEQTTEEQTTEEQTTTQDTDATSAENDTDGNEIAETSGINENEQNDNANSWRYTNGELDTSKSGSIGSAKSSYGSQYGSNSFTRKGIDVSVWNGKINWEKVKAAGIDFAIIRVGYGSDIVSQDDTWWAYNVSECERLGIPFGVYIYSYATNTQMAQSEANHVLRLIAGHNLTYPVYYDMEDNSTLGSQAIFGDIASTFCSAIQNAGYAVGVYGNTNWFTNYLTDARFSQWPRWVAQFNSVCTYQGEYAMWQYSSTGTVDGINGLVDMNYLIGYPANHGEGNALGIPNDLLNSVTYAAHVSDIGWQDEVSNGLMSGTVGSNKHMEALTIAVNGDLGIGVKYKTYVQDNGWQDYATDGQTSGTTGENKYLEAMKVELTGENAEQYDIYYRTHVTNFGWLDWAKNGTTAGTIGYDYSIEAIQIVILRKGSTAPGTTLIPFKYKEEGVSAKFQTHVSDYGWMASGSNGDIVGTVGKNKRIEAFRLSSQIDGVGIKYSSYVQDYGWQNDVSDNAISGTVGKSKQVEAIKIELTGVNSEKYDVYYRTHVANLGWLGWAKNGESAGTSNYNYQMEAMQIMIISKNNEYAPSVNGDAYCYRSTDIEYKAHVCNIGWQSAVTNGELAGTTGRALPVEAIVINLKNQDCTGSISYQAHIRNIGWQNWVSAGSVAGTTGKALSVEALKIELNGKMKEMYDIYYQVHAQDYGWLGWAKNGEMAGTQGCAKSVESIKIKLVKKGITFLEYNSEVSASVIK